MIAVITDFVLRGISLDWKLLLSHVNKLIFFFVLKKSKQTETLAFNRLLVNYNIHFSFYRRRDQTTRVNSCDTITMYNSNCVRRLVKQLYSKTLALQ